MRFLEKIKTNYLIISILMIAAALRFYRIDFQSIWLDEIITMIECNPKISIKDSYDISTNPQASNSKPQSRDRMQMKTDKSPPVGSVTRQNPINQPPSKSRDIVLTPEQKEIAYSLRGFVRDPKTGQKVQDNRTLEEIYKRNIMKGNG